MDINGHLTARVEACMHHTRLSEKTVDIQGEKRRCWEVWAAQGQGQGIYSGLDEFCGLSQDSYRCSQCH